MLKAMKYRIYPSKTQIQLIEKHFGSTRFLYNYFLDYRQKEYAKGNKNYGLGQIDQRNTIVENTVGTTEIKACGVS